MAVRRAICRCQEIAEEMFGVCHASRYDLREEELRSWEETTTDYPPTIYAIIVYE